MGLGAGRWAKLCLLFAAAARHVRSTGRDPLAPHPPDRRIPPPKASALLAVRPSMATSRTTCARCATARSATTFSITLRDASLLRIHEYEMELTGFQFDIVQRGLLQ